MALTREPHGRYTVMREDRFIAPHPRTREACEEFLKGCKPGTTEMVAVVPVAEIDRLRAIEAAARAVFVGDWHTPVYKLTDLRVLLDGGQS